MPAALPSDGVQHHRLDPNVTSAYTVCLDFEDHAKHHGTADDLMNARILGYLIIYSPSVTARHEVVKVIHSCSNNYASLSALGATFLDYYIRPFKRRMSKESSHPSRDSFDKTKEELLIGIKEAPKDHLEAKSQALVRDGFRCVVTKKYDLRFDSVPYITVTDEEVLAAGGAVHTTCAHIVPYFNVTTNSPDKDHSASVLTVLKRFGYDLDNVDGEKVHSLFNVMTMENNALDCFDRLEMWFEKTATPNYYNVGKTRKHLLVPNQVIFTTPDQVKLPLPSPDLLALHASCAQVAHLSGAGEYVDRILEDMERIDVLAHDGTSSDVLYHALITLGSRANTIDV